MIDKMVANARQLHARVQGDDGEIYRGDHQSPSQPKPSFADRIRSALHPLQPVKRTTSVPFDFAAGDRVQDSFHQEATVFTIDPEANHGLGNVCVDYGNGRVVTWALRNSGLICISKAGDKGR